MWPRIQSWPLGISALRHGLSQATLSTYLRKRFLPVNLPTNDDRHYIPTLGPMVTAQAFRPSTRFFFAGLPSIFPVVPAGLQDLLATLASSTVPLESQKHFSPPTSRRACRTGYLAHAIRYAPAVSVRKLRPTICC